MPTAEARRQRHRIWVGVSLIVASLVVVGIGLQAHLQQQNQEEQAAADRDQAACVQDWGQAMVNALDVRVKVNGEVEAANTDRDQAIDDIILVIIRLRMDPPRATDVDVSRALDRYYRVLTRLREVRDAAKVERADNPYPELDC